MGKWIPSDTDPCRIWRGALLPNGYGSAWWKGRPRTAHRVVWEHINGPIPDGHEVHHKCGQRMCVNPNHLELVTHMEHADRHRRTHCKRGHPYDKTIIRNGERVQLCNICRSESNKRTAAERERKRRDDSVTG